MNKEQSIQRVHQSTFESIRKVNSHGQDYWFARDIQVILQYQEWRKFLGVIDKARKACVNSDQKLADHFVQVDKMVDLGSGAQRKIEDIKLSRYACYLIVQNADPSKPVVALGQTYFAVQTRKQEIIEEQDYRNLESEDEKRLFLRNQLKVDNKKLAGAAKIAGVIDPLDYAVFQDHGYKGLYGGLTSKDIHQRKGLKKTQQILDHMSSTELAANLFRATQTEEKLKRDNIKGKEAANNTHFEVGRKVRQTIKEIGGTMPESLPAADSIRKLSAKQKRLLKAGLKDAREGKLVKAPEDYSKYID